MSHFKFYCLHCGQHLEAEDQMAGMTIACPACDKLFAIPAPTIKPSPPAPPIQKEKCCPGCGKELTTEAVICVNYGLNLTTGKSLMTKMASSDSSAQPPSEHDPMTYRMLLEEAGDDPDPAIPGWTPAFLPLYILCPALVYMPLIRVMQNHWQWHLQQNDD